MVKYHKKVNKESPSSLIFIVIFILSLALIIPYYPAFAAEQYDRPVIDDGGNTSGGGSTSSLDEDAQKQRESTLKKVLDKVYSLFGIDVPQIQRVVTPIPTTATTISPGLSPNPSGPIPTNQITPQSTPSTSVSININTEDKRIPDNKQIKGCPPPNSKLNIEGTKYQHLNQQFDCYPYRMFVVHWSAGWSSAQATFNVLNQRERSCQFAIDDTETLQMLDFYDDEVQLGWCAGGDYNVGSINYEITGVYFDDVLKNPGTRNYERLMKMTDTAIGLTCKFIQKYNIPKNAIYGHYEIQSGKQDPGPEYLKIFKERVNKEC